MKLPPETASSWVHISFAAFAWASLKAWSEFTQLPQSDRDNLAGLSTTLRASIDSLLKEARETQDVLIFGRPEAQAKQNAWLVLLKRTVAEVLSILKIKVGGGSDDAPIVRRFLPKLLATITSQKIADRPKEVLLAAGRLEKDEAAYSDKAEHLARLKAVAEGAKAAITGNADAKGSWSEERSEELLAKAKLRIELERTYKLLGAQFPGQSEFVESFFLKGKKTSEGDSIESDDAEENPEAAKPTDPA